MKLRKVTLVIVLILLSLVYLAGCSFTMYNVTFESNGGSNVSNKTTIGYVARPTEPTKDGYTFAGWYIDQELTQEFDFNTQIDHDITLYAKWVAEEVVEYTVKFETNGGSTIPDVKTTSKIAEPENPKKDNYRFDGWFSDEEFTHLFDFNTELNSSLTLYAKWTHIENTEYIEGTYNQDQIDPYILAMTFDDFSVSNSDEYALFLDYAVFNRLSSIELKLKGEAASTKLDDLLDESVNKMKIESTCHFATSYTSLTKTLTTNITYSETATVMASNSDAYTQVPFVCAHKLSTREENFDSFKINNVACEYTVTDSDQLCYVLERGYKPIFASNDCQAKKMYDKACEALVSICDDTFTDIEKLHAIYDWLIENVCYDEALLNKVITNEKDLRKYRGFYLEGVFDDHRAVCDGISKAFMVMARIEGIECIQINGTSIETNVGHAWNKVRINGRWYIIDATGGGAIVNGKIEMLTHRLLMCNDAYYSQSYATNEYTNLVADSGYSIYRDLKYSYLEETHDYYIEDVDELANLLKYYASVNDGLKSIDFYYAGSEVDNAIKAAMQKAEIYGSYSVVKNDGSIIYKLSK